MVSVQPRSGCHESSMSGRGAGAWEAGGGLVSATDGGGGAGQTTGRTRVAVQARTRARNSAVPGRMESIRVLKREGIEGRDRRALSLV